MYLTEDVKSLQLLPSLLQQYHAAHVTASQNIFIGPRGPFRGTFNGHIPKKQSHMRNCLFFFPVQRTDSIDITVKQKEYQFSSCTKHVEFSNNPQPCWHKKNPAVFFNCTLNGAPESSKTELTAALVVDHRDCGWSLTSLAKPSMSRQRIL
ncbi:hypothetical protein PoB_002425400 [Plakobranchus ocellatus]|uniref:Uncharacterized protein n=1 Tax=Plakobranchus ocellatus TaxID=259542 RepID=A0AAV3ZV25_9GAST|nr:hypothetical protein PoB_002425400 [Plakobranchus ocellatus]